MKVSSLYTHDQYLDKSIPYIISNEIIEYDIGCAGFNISRYYGLLDKKTIDTLSKLSKKDIHIRIGLLERDNAEYKKKLTDAFTNIRREFFEANDIKDSDVLSIKKDAIFLLRRCDHTQFGEYVTFHEKNKYTSYYRINKKEFYSSPDKIDVKGISDDVLELHRDYMLEFLHNIFNLMETADPKYVIKELVGFTDAYKSRQLELGYYRELNSESMFRMNRMFVDYALGLKDIDSADELNIAYNYMNYIRPLFEAVL